MNQITKREQEVLHLIAFEHSSKEIANRLYVSYETIISHRKNIMRKLDVKNVAGLVRVGFETGLLRAGVIAFFLLCIPLLNQAQDSRMEITSTAGGSTSMEPLLILTSGQIKRAGIQFSESANDPSAGMSIEFNGRLNGGDNVFNINKSDGIPHTQFFDDGRFLLRGGSISRTLQVNGTSFMNGNIELDGQLNGSNRNFFFIPVSTSPSRPVDLTFDKRSNDFVFEVTDDNMVFQNTNFTFGTTQMLRLSPSGNASVGGFTQLGVNPPAGSTSPFIKVALVEFVQDGGAASANIDFLPGIEGSKILDIKTVAFFGNDYVQSGNDSSVLDYDVTWDSSKIKLQVNTPIGNAVTYTFTIMYRE